MKESEKIEILEKLVDIETVNGNEKEATDYLVSVLKSHGIKTKEISQFPNRSNFIAQIGSGSHPILGLSGHLDTVHQGSLKTWNSDPFKATIKNNRIYGRGTTDMKAGLVQFVITLIELKEASLPKNGTIRLLATISEELTEQGAAYLSDKGYGKDLDAVIFGEPTGVPVTEINDYFASGGAKINPEQLRKLLNNVKQVSTPEQHFIFGAHKGWMSYTVTSRGKAAHSSMPKLGINAIDNLIQYYIEEKRFYQCLQESSEILGSTIYAPDIFNGGKQVNSIPDFAYETVKVRTIPELPNDQLILRLNKIIYRLNQNDGMNLNLKVERSEIPVANKWNGRLTVLLKKYADQYLHEPLPLPVIGASLGTDASEFRRNNSTGEFIVVGPGNTTAHKSNEYVELTAFLNMQQLFKRVALEYVDGFSK
ncbi:M20/M25/M40 family metallo-hydrolase [Lentilactobacillus raoultii]|uniref:M20/M25/M40 family metallo-hydrolase n=1 Tax=Lentilactobacillus raoultii TaxID=1987503 RepID=A0ABW3PH11_9LACO|nr:M20/M25/M40 family metallo-hydrolase [Lentilactobacillus raoultii]